MYFLKTLLAIEKCLDNEEKQPIEGAVTQGEHYGRIISVEGNAVIQSAGQGKTVTHDAANLSATPKEGESAAIKYDKAGKGMVTYNNQDQSKDRGR